MLTYISKDSVIIIHKYKTLWLLSLSRTILMLHSFYIQIKKTPTNIQLHIHSVIETQNIKRQIFQNIT